MFRPVLLASLAAAALAACTATNDPYYRSSANNPPGWVDRNRDGVDDRVEQRRATSYRGGYYDSSGVWRSY